MFMHEESPSLGFDDHSYVFSMCSLPSSSPEYYLDEPINNFLICDANIDFGYENNMFSMLGGNVDDYVFLDYFRGYDPSIDPYCVCLEDPPTKIMWTTFFNHFYDFYMAIDKVKRIFIIFGVILVISSYLLFSNLWSPEFDKLLRALTVSDFMSEVL